MYRYLLLTALLAQISGYCDTDARISQLETDMQKVRAETAYGNFGARTATANPQIDGFGFFATADFLWWKLYEGGTDYLLKSKNAPGTFPIRGDVRHFNFDWEPGFKVGIGSVFEHDGWDANVEFTYFKTHADHQLSSSDSRLLPLVGDETLEFTHAKAHWRVHFYDIDAVIGRNFFVSSFLSLRPFFGITSAWIDQHRHFHFTTGSGDRISLRSKNDFWGIGPRVGLNAQFFFTEHLSCYGNVSGDLLWGDFHVKESEGDLYDLHYNQHRMVPNIAFQLGMAYGTNFGDDCYHFQIKAGYENQYWWRQNQLPRFDSGAQAFHRISDDLSMQGLTLEFRLDF